jgi:hypothetical protein
MNQIILFFPFLKMLPKKKWLKGNSNILVRKMCIQTSEECRSYLLNSRSLKSCIRRKLWSAVEFSTKFLFNFRNIIIVFIHIYPWGPPSLLYNGYRIKRQGSGADQPPPPSTEVKERVELYLHSPPRPSWSVIGWSLPYMMQNILTPLDKYIPVNITSSTFSFGCY